MGNVEQKGTAYREGTPFPVMSGVAKVGLRWISIYMLFYDSLFQFQCSDAIG